MFLCVYSSPVLNSAIILTVDVVHHIRSLGLVQYRRDPYIAHSKPRSHAFSTCRALRLYGVLSYRIHLHVVQSHPRVLSLPKVMDMMIAVPFLCLRPTLHTVHRAISVLLYAAIHNFSLTSVTIPSQIIWRGYKHILVQLFFAVRSINAR